MAPPKTFSDSASKVRREIGERFRGERERLGLTQQGLAEKLGVQRQALVLYESGERTPSADKLANLDRAGGDVNFVVTGRRSGELDAPHKQELELAMSTVLLLCRGANRKPTEVEMLRLAVSLAESMRRAGQPGYDDAMVFAELRRSISEFVG
jgi:transcriptional regulator with XRE-family HTH domain